MSSQNPDKFERFVSTNESINGEDILVNFSDSPEVNGIGGSRDMFPLVELEGVNLTPELIRSIPEDLIKRHCIIPVHSGGGSLTIALSNPANSVALDDIRFFIGHNVRFVTAEKNSIEELIQKYYANEIYPIQSGTQTPPLTVGSDLTYHDDVIVELVNTMISDAISMGASDIHVEPMETYIRVRYRIDDFCYEVNSLEKRLQPTVISRIKVMAGIDVAEKRMPQDGRIKIQRQGEDISLRVSTLPVVHGESVVLRVLDKSNVRKGLETLGLLEEDRNTLDSIVAIPDGMVIVSGPTGSGKTTTLYALLHELIGPEIKIITIEDPVEYVLDGVNQIQVSNERGFGLILKHILRHDPNVIMVGEMRDMESVEIAMRSALTGHKVLSTLHTNDAPSVITRLINMGLPPFMVNASVQAVIYQQLVRTLCKKCRVPFRPAEADILSWMGKEQGKGICREWFFGRGAAWFSPGGCRKCNFSGYHGRTALFEIMILDEEVKELIKNKASSTMIRKAALRHGMRAIRIDGLIKAAKGITSVSEVLRVTDGK